MTTITLILLGLVWLAVLAWHQRQRRDRQHQQRVARNINRYMERVPRTIRDQAWDDNRPPS